MAHGSCAIWNISISSINNIVYKIFLAFPSFAVVGTCKKSCFIQWKQLNVIAVNVIIWFKSGVLNLLVLVYPQIMLNPLRVPLNKNLTQIVPPNKKMANFRDKKDQNGLFSRRFESCYLPTICLRTPFELEAFKWSKWPSPI